MAEKVWWNNVRVIKIDYDAVMTAYTALENLYILSEQEATLLQEITEYLRFTRRYENLSADEDTLDQQISTIQLRLMSPVDICAEFITCLESGVLTESFQTWLSENGYGSGVGSPGETGETPIGYADNPILASGCDDDALFGAITGLVDLMNTMIEDFIEIYEAGTSTAEYVSIILEGIPGVGILPFDDILDFMDTFIENVGENYLAAYTSLLRNKFRCDLFCVSSDTCEVSFQQMADYFAALAGDAVDDITFEDAMAFFLTGSFSGDILVYATHWFLSMVLGYGAEFMGIDNAYLTKVVQTMFNDPDSDHTILCDCEDIWSVTYDFTIGAYGWTVVDGEWQTGVGYVALCSSGQTRLDINKSFEDRPITRIKYVYDLTINSHGGTWACYTQNLRDDTVSQESYITNYNGANEGVDQEYDNSYTSTGDNIQLFIRPDRYTCAGGVGIITSVTIEGTGGKPPEL